MATVNLPGSRPRSPGGCKTVGAGVHSVQVRRLVHLSRVVGLRDQTLQERVALVGKRIGGRLRDPADPSAESVRRLVQFVEADAKEWTACCEGSSQAWLFHRAEWIGVEADFFGAADHSFALLDGGRLVAVQPIYLSQIGLGCWTERLLHSGLHRQTGLAIRDGLHEAGMRAVRSLALRPIEDLASQLGAHRIQLSVQNLAPESLTTARQEIPWWMNEGFQLGLKYGPMGIAPMRGRTTCAADQVVELVDPEDMLFSRLDEACRRAVRKATAEGVEAVVVTQGLDEEIGRYCELARLSAMRTGEALALQAYFERLAHQFGPAGRRAIVNVVHAGATIASVLLGIYKGSATCLGGISHPDRLHLRPNDFAHWSVLQWARGAGLRQYRRGPVFPELSADCPLEKVSRFKRRFGARSFTVIQGSRFLNPSKYTDGDRR